MSWLPTALSILGVGAQLYGASQSAKAGRNAATAAKVEAAYNIELSLIHI